MQQASRQIERIAVYIDGYNVYYGLCATRQIGFNPSEGVELPTDRRREMLFLNAEQVNDLASAAGEYRSLILTLAYGGLRWAETA